VASFEQLVKLALDPDLKPGPSAGWEDVLRSWDVFAAKLDELNKRRKGNRG